MLLDQVDTSRKRNELSRDERDLHGMGFALTPGNVFGLNSVLVFGTEEQNQQLAPSPPCGRSGDSLPLANDDAAPAFRDELARAWRDREVRNAA